MSELITSLDDFEHRPTLPLTARDLDPSTWEIQFMETDCGYPCTPNGCCGHTTGIPEAIDMAGYTLSFPCEDLADTQDCRNAIAIGRKLREVFDFYARHHPPAT